MEGSCHLSFQKTRPNFPHWPMQKQLAASQITMALHFKFAPCKCLKLAEKYITMGAGRANPTQRKRHQGLSCSPSKTTPLSSEVRLASCPESFEKASVTKLRRHCETVCFWFHPVFDHSRSFDDVLEMTIQLHRRARLLVKFSRRPDFRPVLATPGRSIRRIGM